MSMEKKHLDINSLSYHPTEDEESKTSLFFGLVDDSDQSTRLRNGSMKRQYSDIGDLYDKLFKEHVDNDDKGSRMDMRVLTVVEYMRELYVGQLPLLKKMFPGGAKDKFLGFFNKIRDAVSQFKQVSRPPTKSMTMQRSLSAGSPRFTMRGINVGPPYLRDERFKVKTVDAGGGGAGKGGSAAGQCQTKK